MLTATREAVDWCTWVCRRGHRQRQRTDALAVSCGRCNRDASYRGTTECRPEHLYPNWSQR